MRPLLLAAAAALTLAVPAGHAAKLPFSFRASTTGNVTAGATVVVLNVRSSEPARVSTTLYRSGVKLETWRVSVATGRGRVRLPMRPSSRRVGRYTLLVTASAGSETVFRTLRFRIA